MFKRILSLALAVSFVANVAAKQPTASQVPVATEKSVVRSAVVMPLGLAAAIVSAIVADKRFNDGRASNQMVKHVASAIKQLQGSRAYGATASTVADAIAYVAHTNGYKAASDFTAAWYNRVPSVSMPSLPTPWFKR